MLSKSVVRKPIRLIEFCALRVQHRLYLSTHSGRHPSMPNADNQITWRTASLIAACHRISAPTNKINEFFPQGGRQPTTTNQDHHPPGEEDQLPHCLAMGPSEGGAPTSPPSNHWAKLTRADSGVQLVACLPGPISLFSDTCLHAMIPPQTCALSPDPLVLRVRIQSTDLEETSPFR